MIVKCPYCERELDLQDQETLEDGQHVLCPYCNRKFAYSASGMGSGIQNDFGADGCHGETCQPSVKSVYRIDTSKEVRMPWLYKVLKIFAYVFMVLGALYWLFALAIMLANASSNDEEPRRVMAYGARTSFEQGIIDLKLSIIYAKGFFMMVFSSIIYILLAIWKAVEHQMLHSLTLVRLKRRELAEMDESQEARRRVS